MRGLQGAAPREWNTERRRSRKPPSSMSVAVVCLLWEACSMEYLFLWKHGPKGRGDLSGGISLIAGNWHKTRVHATQSFTMVGPFLRGGVVPRAAPALPCFVA